MRFLFFSILVLLNTFYAFGLDRLEAINRIKSVTEVLNKSLPYKLEFLTLQSFLIEGNNYICNLYIDEEVMDMEEYYEDMNTSKSKSISLISNNNPQIEEAFIKSGLNFIINITGEQSHKKKQIKVSSSEFKSAVSQGYDYKEHLKTIVMSMRNSLPLSMGDGLTITNYEIEDNYVICRICTDESVITLSSLKLAKSMSMFEMSIIDEFNNSQDDIQKLFIMYIKKSGMGMKYSYWSDDSAESVNFYITPDMINKYVKDIVLFDP